MAALTHLRDLLQGDVDVAAQVLKALVGDVVLDTRQVERQEKPQMVARFTINAVPALAVLERNRPKDRDGGPVSVWGSIHPSPTAEPATAAGPLRRSFPSSTTAGRPHESCEKPKVKVDSVRKSPCRIILVNHRHALLF